MSALPYFFSSILLAASAPSAPSAFDVSVSVGAGADTNPYEMPADPAAAGTANESRSGAFVPIEARAKWSTSSGSAIRAGAVGLLDGRFFAYVSPDPSAAEPGNSSDLNRFRGDVLLPLLYSPLARHRPIRVDLTVEPFVGLNRETYTSHRTGLPMRVDVDPHPDDQTIVSLARRYDTNQWGARVESDIAFGRAVDLVLSVRAADVDYVEDYADVDEIDSWDHRDYRSEVDLYFVPGDWLVAAGYTFRMQDFRERFPRDGSGDEVSPSDPSYRPQEFTSHIATAKAGFVGVRGRALLRWRGTRRVDEHAGYLDYTENRVAADLRFVFTGDVELRLEPSYSVRAYDDLRVRYDPAERISSRRRAAVEASVEWSAFSRWTRIFIAGDAISQASANPLYSYVGVRGMTGVRVRFR